MHDGSPVVLTGGPLTIGDVVRVARAGAPVSISDDARRRLAASRDTLTRAMADGKPHYGVNTGFGSLARQRVADDQLRELQRNLVRSHSAGAGDPLPREVVRGMMVVLVASLCRGVSGVRPVVVESLAGMLGAGITPVVPEIGSVGASGDLAPLAHVALAMIGEGPVETAAGEIAAADALRAAGIKPIELEAKEGLALINGTHLMAARAALLVFDSDQLSDAAISACAMSIDGCRATDAFLDPRVYEARNQPGPSHVAARLLDLLSGSEILPSHRDGDPRVQDPYSIRCAPIVLGAALDLLGYVKQRVADELGAVTDNPLVFGGDDSAAQIVSAGNFHGMPVAIPLDAAAVALAHIAGIAERRIYHMLGGFDEQSHLPPFLSPRPGLHSGLMIAQYTAAACVNELVGLAAPASVANVPTCAGMEDYNSFGPRSAAKAARALRLARTVVAVELLCAAEAVEHQRPLRSGAGVERIHALVRGVVSRLDADRAISPDIGRIEALIAQSPPA